jgi:uncharacterized DUF497 family protein
VKTFRWNDWNIAHIAEHGIWPEEAEFAIENAVPPWPARAATKRYRVLGTGPDGKHLHVVFIFSPPGVVFVIHARPMSESEKRQYHRRLR